MTGAWRVFRAEAYRLSRSRTVLLAGLFLAAVAALRVVAAHAADMSAYAAAMQRALAQNKPAPPMPPPGNAWAPFTDGWLAGLTVGTLLLLIASARTLASDRETGLLRLASTRSVSRPGLVVGRLLHGVLLVGLMMVVTGLAAWLAAKALFHFGPLVEDKYEIVSDAELHAEFRHAALATVPPLLATWCFGLMVSAILGSGIGAVSVALATWLGFDLFKEALGDRQYNLFAAFNPSFVDHSCLKQFAGIARGLSDAGYSASLYQRNLWLPLPQALVLLLIAIWVTSRKPL
jgi:ABC-2 family transporter protein